MLGTSRTSIGKIYATGFLYVYVKENAMICEILMRFPVRHNILRYRKLNPCFSDVVRIWRSLLARESCCYTSPRPFAVYPVALSRRFFYQSGRMALIPVSPFSTMALLMPPIICLFSPSRSSPSSPLLLYSSHDHHGHKEHHCDQ